MTTENNNSDCCSGGCCGPASETTAASRSGIRDTDSQYSWGDLLAEIKVRCGFGRMSYIVQPGLYRLGDPGEGSPVLVTANYKMSFDRLRCSLSGRDAWILVLDTKGVNVWCAAGKGTFGTEELVDRAESTGLDRIVSHRRLIVPQLGATGVSAFRVKEKSGWNVRFGPVRAEDIPEFLDSGLKATTEMRRVRFPLIDRLILVPVDVKANLKYLAIALLAFILLSGLVRSGYSVESMLRQGVISTVLLVAAFLAGSTVTPAVLPWVPPRSFALKGVVVWVLVLGGFVLFSGLTAGARQGLSSLPVLLNILAWLLIGSAASSYLSMNYTGASTFTSLSGVRREMKVALPAQIATGAAGTILWIVMRFFQGGR